MKSAKFLLAAGALVMLGVILYGLPQGTFFEEGGQLVSLYWGKVTLIDLYLAFFVFIGWVAYRENHTGRTLLITLLTLTLGSLTITLYTLYALVQSKGDMQVFFQYKRMQEKNT
jgi:magnesium-transporting ATPase (P-type)